MGIHPSCILVSDVQGSCVLLFHWTLNRGGTLEILQIKTTNSKLRQRSSVLLVLKAGNEVSSALKTTIAVVLHKSAEQRSYFVKTEQSLLRRKRRHPVPNPERGDQIDYEVFTRLKIPHQGKERDPRGFEIPFCV